MKRTFSLKVGDKELVFKTGEVAKLASGSVMTSYGDSVTLSTACMDEKPTDKDYFPLMVEYREHTYAAGKIPGGFFKREGRPSGKEILTARMIDRPIRPIFPDNLKNEVQVVNYALSSDQENDTDIISLNGASLALSISEIPFNGPIGAVRIGKVDGDFILNPTFTQLEESDINLVVVGIEDRIIMMEGYADSVGEDEFFSAIEIAMENIERIIDFQNDIISDIGEEKYEPPQIEENEDIQKIVEDGFIDRIDEYIRIEDREERNEKRKSVHDEALEKAKEKLGLEEEDVKSKIDNVIKDIEKKSLRHLILEEDIRPDGRKMDELRSIECSTGVLPRTHGSALFTRGSTQALTTATLGTSEDEQMIDGLREAHYKRFMLHYNFPPFSVGEVWFIRGPGRREIGHGTLAERSFQYVLPDKDQFPYTIRVVSDILESNGSSSMATVCGSSLALMDAGIPVTDAVAGIAIGLVSDENTSKLLTDIQGLEDFYGDMDLKVAGTRRGITSIQVDMKLHGISLSLIKKSLEKARVARMKVLDIMDNTISKPREDLSPFAPRISIIDIDKEKIGDVIGPGGKTIRNIIAETGVEIDIEDTEGKVYISSTDKDAAEKAIDMVKALIEEPEVGKIYEGEVVRIADFGAFVEILPGKDGLVHISELEHKRTDKVRDVVNVGDKIKVKVIEIDELGRINLSRKQVLEDDDDLVEKERALLESRRDKKK